MLNSKAVHYSTIQIYSPDHGLLTLAQSSVYLYNWLSFQPLSTLQTLPLFYLYIFFFIAAPHASSGGTLVRICTPCHSLTRSPSALLTRRCCLSMLSPLNADDVMSMAYMLPQPPEMSWTRRAVGLSLEARMAAMDDSAGVMPVSSSRASWSCCGCCWLEEGDGENWRVEVEER